MLTKEDARRLVLAEIHEARSHIHDARSHVTYDLQILRVEDLPFGWIFYWGAVRDGQSGQRPQFGGNGPFLVDRENERLIRTATSIPIARQIEDYERRLRREAHARNTAAKQAAQQP
ncbi:hypothetical protein [Streptomyces fructofermentans]|uniref:Immunity protein 35 domain-containing protein n=1 Tax=Streptomyces fructofermentans TaxID=152141 RepID=A0A918NPG3_9ACTN|nr:hypothetical protein [Streptomyces fructofermentans]GGX85738.1 hypothetical protein GCM10010515_61380 [Streptomyces fructofermentans]